MRTKELLLIVAVCAALFTNAYAYAGEQKRTKSYDHQPMLVDGRVWKMIECYPPYADTTFYDIRLRGGVKLGGKECFVIDGWDLYLYEDGAHVYMWGNEPGDTEEKWCERLNFDLKAGDVAPGGARVKYVDSIMVNGVVHRRLWMNYTVNGMQEVFVEGYGGRCMGLNLTGVVPTGGDGSGVYAIYDGDECVFTKDDFIKEPYHSENVESPEPIYNSFLTEGKVWTMVYKGVIAPWYGDKYAFKEMKLMGDTVINEIHFKEIFARIYSYGEPIPEKWTSEDMFLGEEGGKVYVRWKDSDRQGQAMDFSMQEGETQDFYTGIDSRIVPIHVQAIKDSVMNNTVRKCFYVGVPGEPFADDVWIEGIGSLRWGILGVVLEFSGLSGAEPQLYECRQGNEVLYQNVDMRKPVYHTFVVEGKKWNCAHYIPYHDEVESRYSYYLKGDTVIGGQMCKKMYVEGLYGDTPEYYAAFYEVNGRVYEYPKGRDNSILMYDYVQKAGEKGTFFGKEQEVIRIDTLESQNHSFRVMFVYSGSEGIEGLSIIVGGLGGSIYNMFVPGGLGGANNFLLSCDQDGKKLYDYADISSFVLNEEFVQWFQKWLEEQGQANNPDPQPAWVRLHFSVSKVDPSSGVPSVPKAPPAAPVVMVYDNLLEFQGEHPAYTLSIVDNAGNTLFTTEVPESMMQVMLPFILEKDMEVNLVQGTWRIYGSLDPDHETVKVNGISNHPASPSAPVYDLQGRRLQGEPAQKGIYVRDGKKYVRP